MQEEILGLADIARRWGVSRQYVQYLYKNDKDFPTVFTTIRAGLTPLFKLSDVIAYEPTKNMPKGEAKALNK